MLPCPLTPLTPLSLFIFWYDKMIFIKKWYFLIFWYFDIKLGKYHFLIYHFWYFFDIFDIKYQKWYIKKMIFFDIIFRKWYQKNDKYQKMIFFDIILFWYIIFLISFFDIGNIKKYHFLEYHFLYLNYNRKMIFFDILISKYQKWYIKKWYFDI